MEEVKLGKYRHFKGKEYEVLCIAKDEATLEDRVVYKALYGDRTIWSRTKKSFLENIKREDYEGPRFIYLGEK